MSNPELSIVIPVLNEAANIELLYHRLKKAVQTLGPFELIFVDDGSQDETLAKIKNIREKDPIVKFISFSRTFGQQIALTAGLDLAKGNVVVIIDGDLQDPPEIIPDLYKKYREGFDIVYAVRQKRKGEGIFKKLTSKLFYRTLKALTGFSIPVDVGDFRLMSQRAVKAFKELRERQRYVRGILGWIGFSQIGIFYVRDERHAGKTKYTVRKMFRLALDGITSFSFVPLQVATHMGFWISGLSLIYIFYIIGMKIFTDKPIIGWASTMVAIIFFGGVQLITLGIIGEYIGRISEEVKKRPMYVVKEQAGWGE